MLCSRYKYQVHTIIVLVTCEEIPGIINNTLVNNVTTRPVDIVCCKIVTPVLVLFVRGIPGRRH
jgi:hypothetical protein